MDKILNLVRANIRKEKGQTIVFFMIIFIASMLLNLGLITGFNFSSNYDQKFEEDHGASAVLTMYQNEYRQEYLDYITNYEGMVESEKRDIKIANGEIMFAGSSLAQLLLIYDEEDPRAIGRHTLIESLTQTPKGAVYLPYILKTAGGFKLGDDFSITVNGKSYGYTVAGFYEDYNTSRFSFMYLGLTLDHESYEALQVDNHFVFDGVMLMGRLEDLSQNEKFFSDLQIYIANQRSEHENSMKGFSATQTKTNAILTSSMIMMFVVAFALIITAVSLIIIKFKISNSIEEDMQNIGALKAIGYTSRQLVLSFVVQFAGGALAASLLGIMATLVVLPAIRTISTVNAGLVWEQGLDIRAALVTILILVGATIGVSMLSARKVRKLPPIEALRGGITAHNFKKNVLPIEKTAGSINFLLAMKSMLQSAYQNIMILCIVAAVAFTSVFSLVMYQNMAVDKSNFTDLISGEFGSIMLTVGEGTYDESLKQALLAQEGIRKVSFYDLFGSGYLEDGRLLMIFLSENFDDTENKKCYEGRDPKFDNEIVLNGHLASQIGKKIGDKIQVSNGKHAYEYLITGLMQSGNGDGSEAELTIEGYKRIHTSYEMSTLNVYTEEDADVNAVIAELQNKFGATFSHYANMEESIESMTGTFSQMSVLLVVAIVLITAFIIALIIYLSVKTVIIRQRQEIGIKKALGFTTLQLMAQLALSFTPVVAMGTVLGGIVGYVAVNPLLSIMMRGMGIVKVSFTMPVGAIIILCIGLSLFAFIVSMLVARKIKKISAYKLITE